MTNLPPSDLLLRMLSVDLHNDVMRRKVSNEYSLCLRDVFGSYWTDQVNGFLPDITHRKNAVEKVAGNFVFQHLVALKVRDEKLRLLAEKLTQMKGYPVPGFLPGDFKTQWLPGLVNWADRLNMLHEEVENYLLPNGSVTAAVAYLQQPIWGWLQQAWIWINTNHWLGANWVMSDQIEDEFSTRARIAWYRKTRNELTGKYGSHGFDIQIGFSGGLGFWDDWVNILELAIDILLPDEFGLLPMFDLSLKRIRSDHPEWFNRIARGANPYLEANALSHEVNSIYANLFAPVVAALQKKDSAIDPEHVFKADCEYQRVRQRFREQVFIASLYRGKGYKNVSEASLQISNRLGIDARRVEECIWAYLDASMVVI